MFTITPNRAFITLLSSISLVLFITIHLSLRSESRPKKLIVTIPPDKPFQNLSRSVVIASTTAEDPSWVEELKADGWNGVVYTVNGTIEGTLSVPQNKGNEAMPYLTYIIDHYEELRDITVFTHAARKGLKAWHNDDPLRDNADALKRLKIGTVVRKGYVNLRCNWTPGCPDFLQPNSPKHAEGSVSYPCEQAYADSWRELLGKDVPVPDTIGTTCCAQMAVTKDTIRMRPKEQWAHFRDWLLQTHLDDSTSGRIFEFMWHILFQMEPVNCPERDHCDCEIYGMKRVGCYGFE